MGDTVLAQTDNGESKPERQGEPSNMVEEEETKPKPRRKPSKRSLELEIDDEKLNQLKEACTNT